MLNGAQEHALSKPEKGTAQQNPAKEVEDYHVACQELHRAAQRMGPIARTHLEDNRDVFKIPVDGDPFLFFLVDRPSSPDTVEQELFRFEREHRRAFKTMPDVSVGRRPRTTANERLILRFYDAWDALPLPELPKHKLSWAKFRALAIIPSMGAPATPEGLEALQHPLINA